MRFTVSNLPSEAGQSGNFLSYIFSLSLSHTHKHIHTHIHDIYYEP